MSKTLNMNVSLRQRLANVKEGRPWRNELWGTYTPQRERMVYYVEPGALRSVGFADELVRIRHTGWFTDREFQDETMRGVVYQLPAHNGASRYVAGYHYNGGDDKGATLYFDTLYDDKEEAARMSDEHARVAADKECDYQDEERERIAAEEVEDARLENLAACHPPLHVED